MATTINRYWVGQIPNRPIAINVKDSNGQPINLATYTDFNIRMVGSDNEELDLTGSTLLTSGAAEGRFVFRWPTDRSLFTKTGEYQFQLEIAGIGARDFTTVHTMRVHRLGGKI